MGGINMRFIQGLGFALLSSGNVNLKTGAPCNAYAGSC